MDTKLRKINDVLKLNFDMISEEQLWNTGEEKELKIHHIHSYPAKFPAFITNKALDFAEKNFKKPEIIADIFCGCGTVAFEAKRNNISFWGCDINPVATMIARTKSKNYNTERLKIYFSNILNIYAKLDNYQSNYDSANNRIRYWYFEKEFNDLARLKKAIEEVVPSKSSYRLFFICAFSNILKPTSRWLTKSIKPQVDPGKKPANVLMTFKSQCNFMISAYEECNIKQKSKTEIVTANFLDPTTKKPKVDMIVTSPPYVTSYEYADLHQLSSLWLDYTDDYRKLREGSVGSLHHVYNFERELKRLNRTGSNIVFRLYDKDKAQARSVAKYYLDMQQTVRECESMIDKRGLALFVIGDTEYKGIRIENARHLSESLLDSGFEEVIITKRKISGKFLTPYRDKFGRFTTDKSYRKVYNEEYIIIGRKQ